MFGFWSKIGRISDLYRFVIITIILVETQTFGELIQNRRMIMVHR